MYSYITLQVSSLSLCFFIDLEEYHMPFYYQMPDIILFIPVHSCFFVCLFYFFLQNAAFTHMHTHMWCVVQIFLIPVSSQTYFQCSGFIVMI